LDALAALAEGLLLFVLRGRCIVLVPFDIALGCAHAGGVHRTIWLGAVRRSGLLHAGLRSGAGVLGKGRAAQERKRGDGDKLLHRSLLCRPTTNSVRKFWFLDWRRRADGNPLRKAQGRGGCG